MEPLARRAQGAKQREERAKDGRHGARRAHAEGKLGLPPLDTGVRLLDGCERTGDRQFARSPSAQASGTGHTSLGRCQKQPEQLRVNVGEHSKRARERAQPHPRTCPGTRVRVWPDRQNLASALDTEVQLGDCAAAAPSSVSPAKRRGVSVFFNRQFAQKREGFVY